MVWSEKKTVGADKQTDRYFETWLLLKLGRVVHNFDAFHDDVEHIEKLIRKISHAIDEVE